MLHIHLFGYLRLLVDGRAYRFQGLPRTTSLLAYLQLHRDAPLSREHLAFRLWGDVPESEARANLRRHLHDLNRALPAGVDWVLRDARTVQWNPQAPTWLDVAEFEHLCRAPTRLAEAIALYTGDLLQALYDEWLLVERERLHALYLSTLAQLVQRERERGDLVQAMGYARLLLNQDPLREGVLRDYMLLRHASGDRAGALQLFQQFRTRLAEELGVTPMAETTALYEQLSGHHSPALLPAPAVQEPLPSSAVAGPPHNLPARLTSFVGRQDELAQIFAFVGRPDSPVRLLTVTGPGGAGKTRLALEAAAALYEQRAEIFPDGVFFAGLSGLTTPDRLPMALAETLGLRDDPGQPLIQHLKSSLRDRRLLLLVDNFEHVVDAAPLLVELLTACPGLRLLVTSQAGLHLYGEHELPLEPLSLPLRDLLPPPAQMLDFAAIRLFVERLQAVQPRFRLTAENAAAVAEVCRRLDGLPLALELAAGRGRLFTPAAMLAQLSQRLSFLTSEARNLPARHRTLRATLDWSYNLLAPAEQKLFSVVALFAGPFTAEAAAALLCGEEPQPAWGIPSTGENLSSSTPVMSRLLSLVDKNILRALPPESVEQPRFRMLETLREYGQEKLAQAGVLDAFRRRYGAYYADLAEQGKAGMQSAEQGVWVQRLRVEENNLLAALEGLFDDGDLAQSGVLIARIVTASARFWSVQGHIRELRYWLERALAYRAVLAAPLQVTLLNEAGNVAQTQGDYGPAEQYHQEALALARQEADVLLIAHTLHFLAYAGGRQGEYAVAKARFQECLALYRQAQAITPVQLSALLNNLAIVHKRLGEYEEAIALLQEALALKRASDDRLGLPATLSNLGNLLILQSKPGEAAVHLREAVTLRQEMQDRQGLLNSINQMAGLAVAWRQFDHAAVLYAAADSLHETMGISRTADGLEDRHRDLESIYCHLKADVLEECQAAGARFTLEQAAQFSLAHVAIRDPSPLT